MSIDTNTPAPLALRPRDAANPFGIGERKLWEITADRMVADAPITELRLSDDGAVRCADGRVRQGVARGTKWHDLMFNLDSVEAELHRRSDRGADTHPKAATA